MSAGLLVLVVSDEPGWRSALARAVLPPSGSASQTVEAASVGDADNALSRGAVDVVVGGLSRPEVSGEELARVARSHDVPLVLVVDAARLEAASGLRESADIVPADVPDALLGAAVQRAAGASTLRREVERLRRIAGGARDRVALLGRSERMREMSRQVDELAQRSDPVLIVGAPGSGKNVAARELHARSRHGSSPFMLVSCLGIAETLLESQLVGHRRGAFPGAIHDHDGALHAAAGGTVCIDRLEEMPLPLQDRLAAALKAGRVTPLGGTQGNPVDVRLTCMANRDLESMVRAGTFHAGLHEHVARVTLHLPELSERQEDVMLLAEAFVAEAAERFGVAPRRFEPAAQKALADYAWPGNVRELREAVEHAFARGVGEFIRLEHLPALVRAGARASLRHPTDRRPTLAESEAELVALVLEESGGNKTEAARRLGIDRKRLYRKIRRYGLLGEDEGND